MKHILIIATLSIILSSCSKNQDDKSIVGKWKVYKQCETDWQNNWTCKDLEYTQTFKDDGSYTTSSGNVADYVTWWQDDNYWYKSNGQTTNKFTIHWVKPGKEWYYTNTFSDREIYLKK